jgi:hypothetical protein
MARAAIENCPKSAQPACRCEAALPHPRIIALASWLRLPTPNLA